MLDKFQEAYQVKGKLKQKNSCRIWNKGLELDTRLQHLNSNQLQNFRWFNKCFFKLLQHKKLEMTLKIARKLPTWVAFNFPAVIFPHAIFWERILRSVVNQEVNASKQIVIFSFLYALYSVFIYSIFC